MSQSDDTAAILTCVDLSKGSVFSSSRHWLEPQVEERMAERRLLTPPGAPFPQPGWRGRLEETDGRGAKMFRSGPHSDRLVVGRDWILSRKGIWTLYQKYHSVYPLAQRCWRAIIPTSGRVRRYYTTAIFNIFPSSACSRSQGHTGWLQLGFPPNSRT